VHGVLPLPSAYLGCSYDGRITRHPIPSLLMKDLFSQWQSAWALAGLHEPPRTVFDALCRAYAEPQRHYHTLQHLSECLAQAGEVERLAEHPGEVMVALWFHDAVYDTHTSGNEARSADWARAVVMQTGSDDAANRVHGLVMATQHHAVPGSCDARVLADVDLSILGADAARFDEYERQVREEYRHVPAFIFRRKRRAVLQGFLERPRLFNTPSYVARLEARARDNLRRSIDQLGAGL
jgi:predicted metal-dependent HD superfamily phosphohydrolase